jgi:hypothetical protein
MQLDRRAALVLPTLLEVVTHDLVENRRSVDGAGTHPPRPWRAEPSDPPGRGLCRASRIYFAAFKVSTIFLPSSEGAPVNMTSAMQKVLPLTATAR